ncbi:hypothetical protein [Lactococcus sp. DD01]|uniref:hypothetical protein n=1 Tax=Lactococcus sp. DD01 TaxID=1776443 RepID=UPI0007764DDC|nr:hypothetical protein [Lactococcus sp. DD01]KXT63149.1 Phage minor tail protein [Lactococcus sp. DD01]
MVASGVGQFSINVKDNLDAFYGKLSKSYKTMKELTDRKNQLQIDSKQLDQLRDKGQRIAAEMKELRQQKTEIKLGMREVDDADKEIENLNRRIASLNSQKLQVEADIQPIRTANVQLHQVENEIQRINSEKVSPDFGAMASGLDGVSNKIIGVTKALAGITVGGLATGVGVMKEAVSAASDLEQNTGGVEKLFGDKAAQTVINNSKKAYKTAGVSMNQYLETSTSFAASLIKGLNGDQAKAAALSDKAITDMSDNANIFGTDIGQIQHAYQNFAKGNFTMLDELKLGFGGSQEGAMELVNAYGGLDKKVTDISQVTMPVMIDAIHNAQKEMQISGTTAKEAAKTYEGSLKTMQAAWKNFLATGDTTGLAESITTYATNLDKKLQELTPKIIDGVQKLAKELPEKLKPILENLAKIIAETLDSILGEGFTQNLVDGMKPFFDFLKFVSDSLSKLSGDKPGDLSWIGTAIPMLLKTVVGLKVLSAAMKGLDFAKGFGLKIPSFKGSKGLDGIADSAKSMKKVGVEDLKSLGMKMLTIAGISANIYLAAKALEEVQNVGDLGSLQPKMLAIAEAVMGMGVLVAAAGFINEKKPDLIISGLAAVALIAGDIYLAASALEEVDNINGDFGAIQAKIGQIALCITEIGLLAGAIGLVMDTGIGAAALGSGLLAILGIAGTLYLTGQAISSIANLEIDAESIKINISAIKTAINEMSTLAFEGSVFEALGEMINSFLHLGIVAGVVGIGHQLENLQELELNPETINDNLDSIKDVVIQLSEFGFDSSVFEKFGELLNSFMDMGIISHILSIGRELSKLQELELDKKKVTDAIETIKEVMNSVTGGDDGGLFSKIGQLLDGATDSIDFDLANEKFKAINAIGTTLEELQKKKLNQDVITTNIDVIKSAINSISNFATDDIVNNLGGMAEALATITEEITKNYPPEYADLGKLLATKMNEGFKSSLNFKKAVSERMNEINKDMARGKGSDLATGLNNGFDSTLDLGKKIKNQINDAMNQDYKTSITVDVIKNETTKKGKKPGDGSNAHGGLMTNPYGTVITDSPEKPVLDNGEYVIPKKIVKALGTPFFDKLRSGQISRTFAGLGQKVSHTTSSVVNNIYNNTTNQNMNVYPGPRQDVMFIANRRIRV